MAQPPPYNPNYQPSEVYPPPSHPGNYPPQQNPYPPQPAPNPQVYVHQKQQKSSTEKFAAGVGGAFASVFKSGQDLAKGNGAKSLGKSVGNAAVGIVKSGGQLANDVAKGFKNEYDRTRDSPLLRCFEPGSGIQLVSKTGKGCLRCLPDGRLDGRGIIGNDYSCHWLVAFRNENKTILRNGAFPQYHLSNALNQSVATGVGDGASVFKLHETLAHYVTLQHEMTGQFVGVDNHQNIAPANQVTTGSANSEFEVVLVYSPSGHTYKATH